MKKIILFMITATILLGCNQVKSDKKAIQSDNINEQNADTNNRMVILSLKPTELNLSELPDTIKVAMTNNTNDTITTGKHYRIEKFVSNEWIEISPKDMAFEDMGYDLRPNDIQIFDKNLFKNKINYKPGKYRVVKRYLKSDYQKTENNYNVYAEFEIK